MGEASVVVQICWTALSTAIPMILFAVAFSLVLKVVKIWNFAQAGFMAVAFYAMYATYNLLQWPMWLAVLIGLALTLIASLTLEPFGLDVLRRRKSPHLTYFILTLVMSLFLAAFLSMLFGTEPVPLTPEIMSPVKIVGSIVMSHWDLRAIAVGVVLLLLLHQFIIRTRDGQYMLAVADNAELAELYGISAKRTRIVTFFAASIFITAGMWLAGTRGAINAHMPLQMLIFAVVATLLGGTGGIFTSALAAAILSLIQALSVLVIPSQWQGFVLYVFLFVTILFFPKGFNVRNLKLAAILGKSARVMRAGQG